MDAQTQVRSQNESLQVASAAALDKLAFTSAAAVGREVVAEVLTRGFAGYAVPISMTAASLAVAEQVDSVVPELSCVVTRDGEPVGAALIARRGQVSRLAGMAIVPEARGQGVARALASHVLEEARGRGDRAMVLEVIEQNAPAVALYTSLGFRVDRRLVGFDRAPSPAVPPTTTLVAASPHDLTAVIRADGLPNLPWQLDAETIAQLGSPCVAFRAGEALALLSDPALETITIRALVTTKHERRRGYARRLLEALFARYPGKRWRVSALVPEEAAAVLRSTGFVETTLSQFQMTKPLTGPSAE